VFFFLPAANKKGVSHDTLASLTYGTQPIVYEQGYDQDNPDQYAAALMWPSNEDILQPEIMPQMQGMHQQAITNKTYESFSGELHTQESFPHDSKIADVFKAHTVSTDPKGAEE
jgi:hypothetical protein